jgi:DNA-binding transcriptional ArsR family regulator
MSQEQVKQLDPRSLRALAHPVRIELLALLRREGPATASRLARRMDESSGTTSYHLRQLAAHGFVEEDRGRGSARERWWRSAHRGTYLDPSRFLDNPEDRGALDIVLHEWLRAHFRDSATWLAEIGSWDRRWVDGATQSDYALVMGSDRLAALTRDLDEAIERYRGQGDNDPGAERVVVLLHAFPQRRGDRSGEPVG